MRGAFQKGVELRRFLSFFPFNYKLTALSLLLVKIFCCAIVKPIKLESDAEISSQRYRRM